MERMARAPAPLLATDPEESPVDRSTRVQLTDTGARVLAGEADHVQLNGINRWIGGVHLHGHHTTPWRWHEGTESIAAFPDP
jgi:hypothetical protein